MMLKGRQHANGADSTANIGAAAPPSPPPTGPGGRSGDHAQAKVLPELLEEDEGEHRVGHQADACGNETLPKPRIR